ncbi:MAG: LysM peptidoglycan-binding domain-containing protein [Firmicutes bacterium]|nr:LysM peptidoglycan-binding domain-containing protein [Bacillota bacterium]
MATYTVQAGDTLFEIARRYGTTSERLAELNSLTNPDYLTVGQIIIVPDDPGGTGAYNTVTAQQAAGSPATRQFRGLRYRLTTNRGVYRPGQPVVMSLIKTNVTDSPVTLRYNTGQRYDFTVRDRQGRVVWQWSRGRFFSRETARVVLRPGESQTFTVTWDQRNNNGRLVQTGAYILEGSNVAERYKDFAVSTDFAIRETVTPPSPGPGPAPCSPDNILVNPGFEDWPGRDSEPAGWNASNTGRTSISRRGNYAAEMGTTTNERAVLSQRVSIDALRVYELSWWARENALPGRTSRFVLTAEILYYNPAGQFTGRTEPRFSQENIPDDRYIKLSLSTGRVPSGTRTAEVRFVFEPAAGNSSKVKIDDVSLSCLF